MADHTITISNSFNVFALAATNKWGEMLWGQNWGDGTIDLPIEVEKLILNQIEPSPTLMFDVTKFFSFGSVATTCSVSSIDYLKSIDFGSMSAAFEMSSEFLQDSAGYYYVFTLPTTEAETRSVVSWTSGR